MSDQIASTFDQTSASLLPAVKLWTPRAVGMTTFFLGFPGGIVLASINWMRMGLKNKAISHLIGGAIGAFVFILVLLFTPQTLGRVLGLVINLGMLYYLQSQTTKDIGAFRASNHAVENASGFSGCLIGIGMFVLLLGSAFVIAFLLVMIGVQLPE
jgi:hypothetical protein